LVQAAFNITGIGTLLFIGRLSDQYGRKLFLSGGLFILTVASVGLMFADSILHLVFWRFVQGLGASAHLPIAQAYMGDITPEGNEGKWMGLFNAVLFAGMGAGPLVGGVITDAFSIKTTFLIMAILNILGLLATLAFLKEPPRKNAVSGHVSYLAPLKSRVLQGVFSYRMTNGIGTSCLMAFMPLFASLKIGLSPSLIGILMAARTPVSILQSPTGRLADKWNRRSMVICGGIASIVAVVLLPLTGGFWSLLAVYLFVTLGQAYGIPPANAYAVQEGRSYGMGASMSLFMLAMQIGNGVGPIILGSLADGFGLDSVFYAAGIFMALGVLFFSWRVHNTPLKT
jgi:MFS family permease